MAEASATEKKGEMKPVRVLYLDLDDTVRKGYGALGRFVNEVEDVEVYPEANKQMQRAKDAGWHIVGISNQGGIALGHMSFETCSLIMLETQRQSNNLFEKICFCVHHPDADDPEMAVCWCRKPRAGLVIEAAIDLGRKYDEYYPSHLAMFIGDRDEDRQCAENANIQFKWAKDWRARSNL